MSAHWVVPADLDEYGIAVEVENGRLALSVPDGVAVNDLMTSVAATMPLRDDTPDVAAPMFCTAAFHEWYEASGLDGLSFTAAAGAPELFEIAIAEAGDFFCRGNQAMLLCNDAAAEALRQSGFAVELSDDPVG